jgi:type I restriction enzyme R subunit
MSRHKKEKAFQSHICNYLKGKHGYSILNQQIDIKDNKYYIAKDLLLSFILKTQEEKFKALEKDYGHDSADEIISALEQELKSKPLWFIIRHGLIVRIHEFKLYFPKPRSNLSEDSNKLYKANIITYKDELVIQGDKRIDIVLFLNGLPIITCELKHEDANQNFEDAVSQYTKRNQSDKIFQLPFLHIAADTSDIKVATNTSDENNFRWFNTDLINKAFTQGEYPIEYLYSEVLSFDSILSYLSFFLILVPKDEKNEAFTIFPRYHQMRCVNKVSIDILNNYEKTNTIGANYLINHSAGSGKTLTMSWAADKLHSLYKDGSDNKAIDIIFILTDRKDLDKNISDELKNLSHLKDVIGFAKKSYDLASLVKDRKSIIVSTVHKFGHIVDELLSDENLKNLNIAFLIDEAHRSQDGKMSSSAREPFAQYGEEKGDDEAYIDPNDKVSETIKKNQNKNMIYLAFTATPSQNTVTLFGEPFDIYSEAQAIDEGYILDVASNIISYATLYNMDSKVAIKDENEKLYPKGIIAKALKQIAFADEGLIQYKAEIMLKIFEEQIAQLIYGKAKIMVVTSSRNAGLIYFKVLKEKLEKREFGFPCKVLFAFSDFNHPQTHEIITEHAINDLKTGELIEDKFKEDEYRILVVANKFQTGFDEPLLAGMFLDKTVADKNAVQTLSRLNRCANGKDKTVVVDFTNNVETIFKAFKKYRDGTPYEPKEPDTSKLLDIVEEIKSYKLFTDEQINILLDLENKNDDPRKMDYINTLRAHFSSSIPSFQERVNYIYLMSKLLKQFYFLSSFFDFDEEVLNLVRFSEIVATQLIKQGKESELIKALKDIGLSKANVEYKGIKELTGSTKKRKPSTGGGGGTPPPKVTLMSMLDDLKEKFEISDEEAIIIREICEEKLHDEELITTIHNNQNDEDYLKVHFSSELRESIVISYIKRDLEDRIMDDIYDGKGAILDAMAGMVINHELFNIGKISY